MAVALEVERTSHVGLVTMSWKMIIGLGGLAFAAAYLMGPNSLLVLVPPFLR
jgi:hypothetical protein